MLSVLNRLGFRRGAALLCYAVIIAGSSVPGKSIPKFFELTPDKLIHCAEYLVLGVTLLLWLVIEFPKFSTVKINMVLIAIGSLASALDELYQNLTPGRSPDFYDWCLDVIGILLSIPIFRWMKIIIPQLSPFSKP